MRAPYAALTALILLALLAPARASAQGAPGPGTGGYREVPLDLPADFPPLLCGGSIYLFSSGGRNQTLAPGEPAPACNLQPLEPAAPAACCGGTPSVLTRDGGLWRFGPTGPELVQGGLSGASDLLVDGGGSPVVLMGREALLSEGGRVALPMETKRGNALSDGGLWISGATSGARLDASGRTLWVWEGGLAPVAATLSEGTLTAGTEEGYLVVLDAASGRERFRYPTGGAIPSAPAVVGGLAVFASRDHLVRGVRIKDGQLAWQVRLRGRPDFGPFATRAGLLFGISAGEGLVALDAATGRRTWSWSLPSGSVLQSPACTREQVAVLGWGEASTPTLYIVDVPEPTAAPRGPNGKKRRAGTPR